MLSAVCFGRSLNSNPGAATPESLHKLYKNQAAATANPYTLRQFASNLPTSAAGRTASNFAGILDQRAGATQGLGARPSVAPVTTVAVRRRSDSPPRASFRCVSVSGNEAGASRYAASGALLMKR